MSIFEIITTIISILALIVSGIALWRDFLTRKKVDELHDLEIEKLKSEKERQSKAVVYGYINDDFFIIENSGESLATNIRYEGWQDWDAESSSNIIKILPPHHKKEIKLWACADSPSEANFKIVWDDDSGKNHVWSETLNIDE